MRLTHSGLATRSLRGSRDRWAYASNAYAELPLATLGACGLLCATGVSAFLSLEWTFSLFALSIAWMLAFVYRTRIGNRHWVLAVGSSALLVKLFTKSPGLFDLRESPSTVGLKRDVLELLASDISDCYRGNALIIWSGMRRTTVEWLIIECDPSLEETVSLDYLKSPTFRCGSDETWFVEYEHGRLFVRWLLRPGLQSFLSDFSALRGTSKDRTVVIDVTQFAHLTEEGQAELVGRLKRLGFGAACLMILRRHKQMSLSEALSFVDASRTPLELWSD